MTDDLTIFITVTPGNAPGRFDAKLVGADESLVSSTCTPFLDAARQLQALGHKGDSVLVMKHAGSPVECLRAKVGGAAALTVVEGDRESPRFCWWKPTALRAGSPPIAPNGQAPGGA